MLAASVKRRYKGIPNNVKAGVPLYRTQALIPFLGSVVEARTFPGRRDGRAVVSSRTRPSQQSNLRVSTPPRSDVKAFPSCRNMGNIYIGDELTLITLYISRTTQLMLIFRTAPNLGPCQSPHAPPVLIGSHPGTLAPLPRSFRFVQTAPRGRGAPSQDCLAPFVSKT